MRHAIEHLRQIFPPTVYLDDPSTIMEASSFNISLNQILQGCRVSEAQFLSGSILIFPTFYGPHINGHWYLSILHRDQTHYKGYILDSLGFSHGRNTYISNVFSTREITAQWNYCETILQYEVECGPRTITHICDVIDRLRQQERLETALNSFGSYHIDRKELSTQSREWMHRVVTNNLPCPYSFYFAPLQNEQTSVRRYPIQNSDKAPKEHQREKGKPNPSATPVTQIIKGITSHHVDSNGSVVYFIHKRGLSDDYIFLIHSDNITEMHKLDQRMINQYKSTTAAKYLYCDNAKLISVLDTMEKTDK